jgi:hypothetical protein
MAQQKGQVLLEKNKTSRASPKGNPNSVSNVDAAQGPRTGNAGSAAKRATFVKEKASSGNEKSALANMVMDALAGRGAGMKPLRGRHCRRFAQRHRSQTQSHSRWHALQDDF